MTDQTINPRRRRDLPAALISVAVALAAGGVGALATIPSIPTWYAGLAKPSFNPPNAVFGPVWTTLYVLMALAAWRVWRSGVSDRRAGPALALYAAQLGLNVAWSVIFFGLHKPGLALGEVALLLAAILATAAAFWRLDRLAGLLMAPYVAWVAFASALNFAIWRLNP